MRIELNEVERALAIKLGVMRHTSNRQNNIADAQIGKQSALFIDINGVGGEIAAAKACNVYPDLDVVPQSGTWDLTINGKKADVKTTDKENGRLLVRPEKIDTDTEVYLLVVGVIPTYRIAGYAYAEEIFKEENLVNLGHGPTYALSQEKLIK